MKRTFNPQVVLTLCLTLLALPLCGQTRITLGDKPKVQSALPSEEPLTSTKYTSAEKQKYQHHIATAYRALLHDSLGKAEDYFTQAVKLLPSHPSNAEVYFMLGQIAESRNQYQQASNYYKKSIRQNENMTKSYERKGAVDIILGNYDTALRNYNTLLQLKPGDHQTLLRRGYVSQCLGRTEQSLRDYQSVLSADPANAQAASAIATIWGKQGKFDEAIALLDKQIALHPTEAQLYNTRGMLEAETRKLELALYDLDKAVAHAPKEWSYLLNRSIVHTLSGNKALAEQDCDNALKLGATKGDIERSVAIARQIKKRK